MLPAMSPSKSFHPSTHLITAFGYLKNIEDM